MDGVDLPTPITIAAPVQLVGTDGLVSISSVNGGSLLRFEDANPAEINHSFTTTITFGSPNKIRFGADSSIGVSNITPADRFQFEAINAPVGFEWTVLSSSNASIVSSGTSFTVSGTTTSPFAEFDVYSNLPIETIKVTYLNLTTESPNSGQFVFQCVKTPTLMAIETDWILIQTMMAARTLMKRMQHLVQMGEMTVSMA